MYCIFGKQILQSTYRRNAKFNEKKNLNFKIKSIKFNSVQFATNID